MVSPIVVSNIGIAPDGGSVLVVLEDVNHDKLTLLFDGKIGSTTRGRLFVLEDEHTEVLVERDSPHERQIVEMLRHARYAGTTVDCADIVERCIARLQAI